ncbi:MAG: class I SAM-dependent methyltransferase [Planctomycetota bacterium]
MLQAIELPSRLFDIAVPTLVTAMITDVRNRIEVFQDRWDQPQIEQFVAADYELVYQALIHIKESQLTIGSQFLEWGCGFAAVSVLAASLGYNAFGVEAEADLLPHGHRTVHDWTGELGGHVELFEGNFLPPGTSRLAEDPTLPSLHHPVADAYETLGLNIDDFAIIYSYPWPGEDDFHEAVFDATAARGAILLQFRGPNEMVAWRKTR